MLPCTCKQRQRKCMRAAQPKREHNVGSEVKCAKVKFEKPKKPLNH